MGVRPRFHPAWSYGLIVILVIATWIAVGLVAQDELERLIVAGALCGGLGAALVLAYRDARRSTAAPPQRLEEESSDIACKASFERYRTLVESSPDAILFADTEAWVRICNRRAAELYGYADPAQLLGASLHDLIAPKDRARAAKRLQDRFGAAPKSTRCAEYRMLRQDGTVFMGEANSAPVADDGGVVCGITLVVRDITERKQAEEILRERDAQYRSVVEVSFDGILVTDLNGVVLDANQQLVELLGYASSHDLVDRNTLELAAEAGDAFAHNAVQRLLAHGRVAHEQHLLRRRDGTTFPVEMSAVLMPDSAGTPAAMLATLKDITERMQYEEDLRHQALHDALTNLPNRALLIDRLEQAILAGERLGKPLALLLMDLNRFKEVNDTLGHHFGDLLLQDVGPRLKQSLRDSDMIARLGGDEFAVLAPGTDEGAATQVAQRILEALDQPFIVEGQTVDVGASIGIALYPDHGLDATTLLRRADVAMYVAKRGANECAVYRQDQDEFSPDRLALMSQLRHAIDHDELVLHYQPKIHLATGRVEGVEALVRWQHPERGFIPPDSFISLAEETGLIKQLSVWVLDRALRQCRTWLDTGLGVRVAVNLSARNLTDPELTETVAGLLESCKVPPEWLQVELTESAVMTDAHRSIETLRRLEAMGIHISIDDFGTGYSSLAYLKQLPISEIKIDRSFIKDMKSSDSDSRIVRATISLGRDLGLQTVAEGVEDVELCDILATFGCDLAQGYHFARPLSADLCTEWLQNRQAGHRLRRAGADRSA